MFEIEKPKAWYSSPWFIIAIIVIVIAAVGVGSYFLLKGEEGKPSGPPDFEVLASPAEVTIPRGGEENVTFTIKSINGFNSTVVHYTTTTLNVGDLRGSGFPARVTPPPDGQVTVTVTIGVGPYVPAIYSTYEFPPYRIVYHFFEENIPRELIRLHTVSIPINITYNQAHDDGSNLWDDGYPSGGNYWGNYIGVDADGDGIGDTPHSIFGDNNQDRYPLINPMLQLSNLEISPIVDAKRSVIRIEGNAGFTAANGVVSGSGTTDDPYIIENWDISAENASGIYIRDTTAYFIIRNCYVHDEGRGWESGIYFNNVRNGMVENVRVENMDGSGIVLAFGSSNNTIDNNFLNNNRWGIFLDSSDNNLISNNIAINNRSEGISLDYSDNNLISNNLVENNGYGIYLEFSNSNLIYHNDFINN